MSSRFQYTLNYTWSSTRSNYDGDNTLSSVNDASQTNQDFFDVDANWGPAIGDVAHSFISSVIYETPGANWSSTWARTLFGQWQVSGIFRLRTGEPLIITQPSSKAGSRPDVIDADNAINTECCDIDDNNMQYLNPAAFQLVPLERGVAPDRSGPAMPPSASSGRRRSRTSTFRSARIPDRRDAPPRAARRHSECVELGQLRLGPDQPHGV